MADLPDDVIEEAERLTRLAREVPTDEEAALYRDRRETLLADHAFTARVREGDATETLVLHPEEWVEDGTIRPERIDDTDRAIEVHLSGPADPDDWGIIEEHNRAVARRVREEHGDVHGANADAFADFMGNHYARRVGTATPRERAEFLTEYFVRNAWPSEEQKTVVELSLEHVERVAKEERS
ncbi:DUF7108 family protein [Halalkalicoccus ordinarius]|uniref:DUF7108 family protein n=1 Tax=Halalkalicoccus ordinarius TaxID=3116651 RepID=UPI00300EE539